ncbi:CDP-alcohol phosphatidyltransferase family protein [Spiractinospora alimapuensis]|uniref:phosphatidylinositol phosphate synthase n=1 Tax=Spiractinospora alimapuensis TaxID=2820884 RepID=UPI001F2D97C3|nr:CDP-alcohol phosphatidyltransferase family protein [Spiractinospora alimapuensis]QVQ52049.1 CDP-alcohol phosphatidyltransferase family protein [Spiractinospora alimapuensis]
MLNELRPTAARVLDPIGRGLARLGFSANAVTGIGSLGATVSALVLYPMGALFLGSLLVTFFVLFDMLDGAVARAQNRSNQWGAFLDSTLDRVADAAVFCGLLVWFVGGGDSRPFAALTLVCMVLAFLIPYIKARSEGLGVRCDVGIAERPVRLVIILTAVGVHGLGAPYVLAVGLWLLAGVSAVTVLQRVLETWNRLSDPQSSTGG